MTSASVESDDQHFVGNEVTNPNVLMGNYILAGTGHIQHGNMVKGTLTPAGTTPLNDSSYYLLAPPSFWGSTGAWPSIGIPNSPGSGMNPAKARYQAGGQLTVCREDFTTKVSSNEHGVNLFSISPNPFYNELQIYSSNPKVSSSTIVLRDITGRKIIEKQMSILPGSNQLHLSHPEEISAGLYVLSIISSNNIKSFRILKQ